MSSKKNQTRRLLSPVFIILLPIIFCPLPKGTGYLLASEQEIPRALDFELRESESYSLELTPNGGEYFGDKLNHSFVVGQNIQWNLTPALGIITDFGWSKISVDGGSPLGRSITNKNLYMISGGFAITKPAAYRSKNHVVEMDFFTTIGGGAVFFNEGERGMGFIGGGIKTRFKKVSWFALKVEFRENLFSIPNPGGSDFASDATLTVGPTFMLWAEE
ncbi:MAG: hypothetical protein HYT76_09285 [Deltaproteobacteria bacterium]|nr:hypothetical protein [Deltaproteobacteria bacterium]